jgi:hypothetical protein
MDVSAAWKAAEMTKRTVQISPRCQGVSELDGSGAPDQTRKGGQAESLDRSEPYPMLTSQCVAYDRQPWRHPRSRSSIGRSSDDSSYERKISPLPPLRGLTVARHVSYRSSKSSMNVRA